MGFRRDQIEADAVEVDDDGREVGGSEDRRLPERAASVELAAREDVRNAALAAAGGIVAGVATVAAVRVARSAGGRVAIPRRRRSPKEAVASRSFLIDVHVLGR